MTNKEELDGIKIPTIRQVIEYTDRLRQQIWDYDAREIVVPGQGGTWVSRFIGLKTGEKIEIGWSRIRDEYGALVWGEKDEMESGHYCVMYIDPYVPYARSCEITGGGRESLAINISDLQVLFELENKINKKR